jgi:hypothetical protein
MRAVVAFCYLLQGSGARLRQSMVAVSAEDSLKAQIEKLSGNAEPTTKEGKRLKKLQAAGIAQVKFTSLNGPGLRPSVSACKFLRRPAKSSAVSRQSTVPSANRRIANGSASTTLLLAYASSSSGRPRASSASNRTRAGSPVAGGRSRGRLSF